MKERRFILLFISDRRWSSLQVECSCGCTESICGLLVHVLRGIMRVPLHLSSIIHRLSTNDQRQEGEGYASISRGQTYFLQTSDGFQNGNNFIITSLLEFQFSNIWHMTLKISNFDHWQQDNRLLSCCSPLRVLGTSKFQNFPQPVGTTLSIPKSDKYNTQPKSRIQNFFGQKKT